LYDSTRKTGIEHQNLSLVERPVNPPDATAEKDQARGDPARGEARPLY
jgi:hypothetical protein